MKKEGIVIVLLILVLFAIAAAVYYGFFYSPLCESQDCFSKAIVKCNKATYLSDNSATIIEYKILGKAGDKCKISMKLVELKIGTVELMGLQGKEMTCLLPYGVLTYPEENPKMCSGELKEGMQEIVIDRMHSQIVSNLGKIDQSITKVL